MQSNVHTPERLNGETQEQYKLRRKISHHINRTNGLIGVGGVNARKSLRDAQRASGAMKKVAGSYGQGLRNWINRTQAAAIA